MDWVKEIERIKRYLINNSCKLNNDYEECSDDIEFDICEPEDRATEDVKKIWDALRYVPDKCWYVTFFFEPIPLSYHTKTYKFRNAPTEKQLGRALFWFRKHALKSIITEIKKLNHHRLKMEEQLLCTEEMDILKDV